MSDPKNRAPRSVWNVRKGPIGQRDLLRTLKTVIDMSASKSSSRSRDEARRLLRRLLAEANWRTPFIYRNLGARRCRYISSLGYIVAAEHLSARPGDVERLNQSEVRRG